MIKCVSCGRNCNHSEKRGNYCAECDKKAGAAGKIVADLMKQKEDKEAAVKYHLEQIKLLQRDIYLLDKQLWPIVKGNLV